MSRARERAARRRNASSSIARDDQAREASAVLGRFSTPRQRCPTCTLAIKTHPAETPDVYADASSRAARASRVLPRAAPLAPLLRASRAVVTVNSTVALDAAVLGVPALVIGLPNN